MPKYFLIVKIDEQYIFFLSKKLSTFFLRLSCLQYHNLALRFDSNLDPKSKHKVRLIKKYEAVKLISHLASQLPYTRKPFTEKKYTA